MPQFYIPINGTINGTNTVFSLVAVPGDYTQVVLGGLSLTPTDDYTLNGFVLNFVIPPLPNLDGSLPSLFAISNNSTPFPSPTPGPFPNAGIGGSTIITRALDASGDPLRGNGLQNFVGNAYAVAQIIAQRLQLLKGSWWMQLSDGLPLFQSILGVPNTSAGVALILRQRILGTVGVTGIQVLLVNYLPAPRSYTVVAVVQTQFGSVALTNNPVIAPGITWALIGGTGFSTVV